MAYKMKGFSGFKATPIKQKMGGAMERQISNIEKSANAINSGSGRGGFKGSLRSRDLLKKRYGFMDKYGPMTRESKQKLIDLYKSKEAQIRKKKIKGFKKRSEILKKIDQDWAAKKQGTKSVVGKKTIRKKLFKKIASRAIPYAGWALAASDAYGIGKKMYKGASFKEATKEQFLGIKTKKQK